MAAIADSSLGRFLQDCRRRLDPCAFGFEIGRRRTPGLRREEVAQLANISPTWYTCLEQDRGGAPSKEVLNRIAAGLMLNHYEREHLFILAFGHLPEAHYTQPDDITPRLQRVLDALSTSPALIKTATWDVVAWNRAAAAVLTDFSKLPRDRRNILRILFSDSHQRGAHKDWQAVAKYAVGAFRADAARMGASAEIAQLVDELSRSSHEFDVLWRNNEVAGYVEAIKRIQHPQLGALELEWSLFAIQERPDLNMVVYQPTTRESERRIQALIATTHGA